MIKDYKTSIFSNTSKNYYVGLYLKLGSATIVPRYAILESMPNRSTLRQDSYHYWLNLPTLHDEDTEEVEDLFMPSIDSEGDTRYPGFDFSFGWVISNSVYFLQDVVNGINSKCEQRGDLPVYTSSSKVITTVNIKAPIDFAVIEFEDILQSSTVRYYGEVLFKHRIKKTDSLGRGLPKVLLIFENNRCAEIEVHNAGERLESQEYIINSDIPVTYHKTAFSSNEVIAIDFRGYAEYLKLFRLSKVETACLAILLEECILMCSKNVPIFKGVDYNDPIIIFHRSMKENSRTLEELAVGIDVVLRSENRSRRGNYLDLLASTFKFLNENFNDSWGLEQIDPESKDFPREFLEKYYYYQRKSKWI